MSLEEKIGQKIMLDFRYWDSAGGTNKDMTQPDEAIAKMLTDNAIGGVILFANNLKDKAQIARLTSWYASLKTVEDMRLFIATDNEGGNVFRLPRGDYAAFPGNMALGAAVEGGADADLAYRQASLMAHDLRSLHINTNFAPVMDVNTNPLNPVINVRAFSDDVAMVARLAEKTLQGMHHQQVISVCKHFPGHGSTSTDSHTSLPCVNRTREQAFAIDIAPYKQAIHSHSAPEMIMTAHIQYPALDNSQVTTRKDERITVPATMSREIQSHILRDQLEFEGVTISDALDMGAIAEHFTQEQALLSVFSAGVDIALMPIAIQSPAGAPLLTALIASIATQVRNGSLAEAEIDASVERILRLKQRYHLQGEKPDASLLPEPSDKGEALAKSIADRSITLVINQPSGLPLTDKKQRYFILTPWHEQAAGIADVMAKEGYQHVIAAKITDLNEAEIRRNLDSCDVFLLGTLSTRFTPVETDGIADAAADGPDADNNLSWLRYAAKQGKKRVHLSLRAPYDIVNYSDEVNAAVAVWSYYGYDNGVWRGQSMISLAEVLIGKRAPLGKLPVNTWRHYDAATNCGTVAYPRGYGLSWDEKEALPPAVNKCLWSRRRLCQCWCALIALIGLETSCKKKAVPQPQPNFSRLQNSMWLPGWRMKLSFDSALQAVQKKAVQTLSPFWYEVDKDGLHVKAGSDGLVIPDKNQLVELKKQGARIIPTMTTTLSPADFISLYSSKAQQQSLGDQICQQIAANDFDGIGIDFETIALTTDTETASHVGLVFTALCTTLSQRMQKEQKLLAITVMPRWSDRIEVWRNKLIPAVYDYQQLSGLASLFRVMAYDQHAPNTEAGPIAGYQWVKNICSYTASKVKDAGKVEIGIPLYGRDWGSGSVKSVLYNNVTQLKMLYPDSVVEYCAVQKEETFTYSNAKNERHVVWYSNNQSVLDRLALIRSWHFGGAAFWAASYEDPMLWQLIANEA